MDKEIKRIINELESCIGMFDYLITPEDNELLVLHIKELQEKNEMFKQKNKQLQQENINLREGIYIKKISFPSEGKNFKELMEMPTYQELQQENQYLKSVNSFSKRNLYKMNKDRLDANLRLKKENKELHNKIDKAIEELDRIITFCENDSQGGYNICNMAIRNYKNIRNLLKDIDVDE